MHTTARSLKALAESLASTFPGSDDARLALALLEELANGKPVTLAQLARAADRDESDLAPTLERWPNVHRDGQARVVAFGGLGVTPTPHRFEVAGRQLYTWCAWDTLFLPALLGQEARVESTCPVTATQVTLVVAPDGVRAAEPRVAAGVVPGAGLDRHLRHHGLLLLPRALPRRPGCRREWLGDNPGALTLSLDDAFELGRLATQPLLQNGRAD